MANRFSKRLFGVSLPVVVPCVFAIGGALLWVKHTKTESVNGAKNYVLAFAKPDGWRAEGHGPQTLFKYQDPKSDLILRGAVNQVISEVNPTPDLDTDGIAQFYVDRTTDNMPTWTAEKLGKVDAGGTSFELVRRATNDRVVVTAYAVKGNTTVLVSLFGKDGAMKRVDPGIPDFKSYLATLSIHEKDLSNL
jgi:hypothetical protein